MINKIFSIGFLLLTFQVYSQDNETFLRISFMGDIMQHGPQIRGAYNPVEDNYDYFPCFQHIAPSIREADIAIANLELTLAGKPYSGYPTFSAPDELALALKNGGIDILVTANNHSLDRRKKGLERTIKVLDSLRIPHTGTFRDSIEKAINHPLFIEKKGVKIALLDYTYGTNGIPVTQPNIVNLLDTSEIKQDLIFAKNENADVIIVFTHWGWEYQRSPNDEQKTLARFCRKNGADMVIGSHPHVLQPIEQEDDFITVYSLGNFVSNQRDRYKDGGMIFTVVIEADTVNHQIKIVESGYQLTWVYKKPSGNVSEYFILPAAQSIVDNVIESDADKEKRDLFLSDSRKLFAQNNKGPVREYKYQINRLPSYNYWGELIEPEIRPGQPKKPSALMEVQTKSSKILMQEKGDNPVIFKPNSKNPPTCYRIQFVVKNGTLDISRLDKNIFIDIYTENVNGMTRYMTGKFHSREEAEDHLLIIKNETRYRDAFIVERE